MSTAVGVSDSPSQWTSDGVLAPVLGVQELLSLGEYAPCPAQNA